MSMYPHVRFYTMIFPKSFAIFVILLCCAYAIDNGKDQANHDYFEKRIRNIEGELKSQQKQTERLEDIVNWQQNQLKSLEDEIKFQKGQNQEQTFRIKILENELKSRKNAACKERLCPSNNDTLQERTGVHPSKSKMTLRRRRFVLGDMTDTPVGFTAYLDHKVASLGINQIIPFNKVLFNDGAAYNNSTGTFVCPVDGVYMFFFSVSNQGGNQLVAKLVVDGANYVDAIADSEGGTINTEAQGSNMAIVRLSSGSHVSIENYRWGGQAADGSSSDHFTSFSGILLYQ